MAFAVNFEPNDEEGELKTDGVVLNPSDLPMCSSSSSRKSSLKFARIEKIVMTKPWEIGHNFLDIRLA